MAHLPFKSDVSISYQAIPHAMIDGLRRRLTESIDGDAWDANQELQPEVEEDTSELPNDKAALPAGTKMTTEPTSNEVNLQDYYRGLIMTAIEQGGSYRGQQMSVPWLRMTLAGLESRPIEPEVIWEDAARSAPDQLAEIPSYDDLFPLQSRG
jgi:hypothetical protein